MPDLQRRVPTELFKDKKKYSLPKFISDSHGERCVLGPPGIGDLRGLAQILYDQSALSFPSPSGFGYVLLW